MKTEFHDQQEWMEIHRKADELIATKKDDKVIAAIYWSPEAGVMRDQIRFAKMLGEWAAAMQDTVKIVHEPMDE